MGVGGGVGLGGSELEHIRNTMTLTFTFAPQFVFLIHLDVYN